MIGDEELKVAKLLGMLPPEAEPGVRTAADNQTVIRIGAGSVVRPPIRRPHHGASCRGAAGMRTFCAPATPRPGFAMTLLTPPYQTLSDRYAIEREIGAGGMAVVYLAEDIRHRRKVALKVLRPELAAVIGADRFIREIETTASLQHSHILPLHDSGTVEGTAFYVMPYIEGESLRQRLSREKQLPIDEAVRIAREVASALDYAHRRGIVHRDIKPENILLHDGQAVVADFGIALAVSSAGGGTRMTETGMSLGTPHYMSPEQAMGERELGPRSDVYALGCVLYEMLLGEPPFTGPTAQAIVARVVTDEPRSITAQRKSVPAHVEAAVRNSLEKLPADRFASAAEFSAALGDPGYTGAAGRGTAARTSPAEATRVRTVIAATAGLVVVGALAMALSLARRDLAPNNGDVTRFHFLTPSDIGPAEWTGGQYGPPAIAPDGRFIAYSFAAGDTAKLYVRHFNSFEPTEIPGGGRKPAISPSGEWIAFLRGESLWKVESTGGEPARVARIHEPGWNLGRLAWHQNGRIYVAGRRGIWEAPASGGEARLLHAVDTASRETIWSLTVAPDGRLLFSVVEGGGSRLVLLNVDDARRTMLDSSLQGPAIFIGDLLVFSQSGQPRAVRFDLGKAVAVGDPVALSGFGSHSPDRLGLGRTAAWFDADPRGGRGELVWVSRTGEETSLGWGSVGMRWPRVSPDGRRIAAGHGNDLYVTDIATGARRRITGASEPVWSSDGRFIAASVGEMPTAGLLEQRPDAGGSVDTLLAYSTSDAWPTSYSPDGAVLAYYGGQQEDQSDLYFFDRASRQVRHTPRPGSQRAARFSPDGRWLAYQTGESGRTEIVVQPWPAMDVVHPISAEGGDEPLWSPDGRELYFRSGSRIMAVRILASAGGIFESTPAVELFRGPYRRDPWGDQSYDVAPDGRFLLIRSAADSRLQINVIRNWGTELERAFAK
jgi:eukaryotic-like serine/threonine-protein kinase